MDAKKLPPAPPVERRRFLRESLRGSLPLLVEWVGGRARGVTNLLQEPAGSRRRTAPPPAAEKAAPEEPRRELDQRHEEFSRDNPEPPDLTGS